MVYPMDHANPELHEQPKGMKAVLQERESVWAELVERNKKVVGKCKECQKSQAKKDAERRVAAAEAMGQEDTLEEADLAQVEEPDTDSELRDEWCCMYRVLSLQEDFANKKPMLQHYIEGRGHVCMFLPKFHCELNPIEMLWGFAKYRKYSSYAVYLCFLLIHLLLGYRLTSDGKFATAKQLVPECLGMCDTLTIRRFFRKTWRYIDAYS